VVVGAMVFAGLILIMLLGERGSNWMWASRTDAFFYCRPCDLRYPKSELRDPAQLVCPRGHLTEPVPKDFPVGTMLIYACVGFVGFALVMVATGIVRTP
jgi:hypothetical protein